MSRFKFRAWDINLSKMSKVFTFGNVLNFTDDKGIGSIKSLGKEHVVMQFTGLWDSDHKDLYEGDIIESKDSEGNPVRHLIEYDDTEAMFKAMLIPIKWFDGHIITHEGSLKYEWIKKFEKKHIGNRIENKELLL
jgi:uncharacterized phage protein (TIGR01671 family)